MAFIKLKPPSDWTIPDGIIGDSEKMSLDRVEDYFTGATLDAANFGIIESGGGVARQTTGFDTQTPVSADTAIGYFKDTIDKTVSDSLTLRQRIDITLESCYLLAVQQTATPITGSSAVIDPIRIIEIIISSSDQFLIVYFNPSGVIFFWNGSAWTTSASLLGAYVEADLYESVLEWTPTQWRIIFRNITTGVTIATTSYVPWTSVRNTGADPLFATFGDMYTNSSAIKMTTVLFKNQYKTDPLVATMGAIVNGAEIIDIPITEIIKAGASITWRYDIGSGLVTAGGGTLAELKAALVGTSPATLDLESTFTSDGDAGASFDINGGVIACTDGVCDYPDEGEVTIGTIYDNGNLTGKYKEVPEINALLNYKYGADGTEFTGELRPTIKGPVKVIKLDTGIKVIKL